MHRAGNRTKEQRQGRREKTGRPAGRKESKTTKISRFRKSVSLGRMREKTQGAQDGISGWTGECGIMGEVGSSLEAVATRGPEVPGKVQPTRGQVMDRLREFLDVVKEQGSGNFLGLLH